MQGELYVFGKKADKSFVIGYQPRESNEVEIGVLSGAEASIVDIWIGAQKWYENADPWTRWAVNGVCAGLRAIGVGRNMMDVPSHHEL